MERRVVITGTGVITPVGNNVETFWNSLINGVCGIDYIKDIPTEGLTVKVAGQVKDFKATEYGIDAKSARKHDRFCLFALAAAYQAMKESGLKATDNCTGEDPNEIPAGRLGVYIGSGIGGMETFIEQTRVLDGQGADRISPLFIPKMISNIAGGNIAIRYNAQGPCLTVVSACATGTNAIGEAFRAIRHGYSDAIIAGGAEAVINPLAIGGFANCKALTLATDPKRASLPFNAERGGFVMAEGGAVLILEEYEHALARGAEIIAEVCGYGNNCDAHHATAPRPDGQVAAAAMKDALAQANYREGEALYINAHGTGTMLNDKTETLAIKLALGEEDARRASVSSTKSMTGHMFGATGAAELIASAFALRDGIIPPTIGLDTPDPLCDLDYTPNVAKERPIEVALSNSLGFGGHNACVALRKYKGQ